MGDFSLRALYDALDQQRQSRGLTWVQARRDINSRLTGLPVRPVAASTITTLRDKALAEGDGVLQMLVWLHRTPESFVSGYEGPTTSESEWPNPPGHLILRFDTPGIYAALEAQRLARGLTWKAVAGEIGIGPAPTITRLAKGGRTAFPQVMRISRWLNRPALSLTRLSRFQ